MDRAPGARLGGRRGRRSLLRLRDAGASGSQRGRDLRVAARGGRDAGAVSPRRGSAGGRPGPGLPHRLHGRGRRRAADRAGRRGPCLARPHWGGRRALRPRRARHAASGGLLPALRERPLDRADADRGRPQVGLRARQGLRRRRAPARAGRAGHGGGACALLLHRRGDPARGLRGRGRRRAGRRGHERYPLALHGSGDRDGLRAIRPRLARNGSDRGRARQAPRGTCRVEAPLQEGGLGLAAAESYPDELLYHSEHDWVRIEGEEATFGITWYAQDALGEVVFYEPPEVGSDVTKDQAYAEVESVKAVSDVYAPLSGEIVAVNEALADA